MENAIALKSATQEVSVSRLIPTEHEMAVYHTMAEKAITSKMYGSNYKDTSAVMMIMLSARELGIPPMQALNGGINIIQGRVEISARMMSALIRRSGHKIKVQESTATQCVLYGTRGDTGETQSASFCVAEAQLAGLIKPGGSWVKWPKDMCFARALSRLARQLFSDVVGIGYVEGEISGNDTDHVEKASVEPEIIICVESLEDLKNQYLQLLGNPELEKAEKYLHLVMNHFEVGEREALQMLLDDPEKLKHQFTKWESKKK